MQSAKAREEKREALKLFPHCGHTILSTPSPGDLLPLNRTLEVQLNQDGDDSEPCPYCTNPNPLKHPPPTLRDQLAIGKSFRAHYFDKLHNPALPRKLRVTAGREVESWSLDIRYIEGIISGASAKPIYSLIYENHFDNEHGAWLAESHAITRASKTAVEEGLRAKYMKMLDFFLRRMQHDLDCGFAFAQGTLVGRRWAEGMGVAVPSERFGTELERPPPASPPASPPVSMPQGEWENATAGLIRPTVVSLKARRHIRGSRGKRRMLVKMVKMGERFIQETEQLALPACAA